jgi:hypothetical protein
LANQPLRGGAERSGLSEEDERDRQVREEREVVVLEGMVGRAVWGKWPVP